MKILVEEGEYCLWSYKVRRRIVKQNQMRIASLCWQYSVWSPESNGQVAFEKTF
jgi:hypothetical protein